MNKQRLRNSILLLLVLGIAGCGILPISRDANDDQEIIRTAEITVGDFYITVPASGNTSANEQRDVYFTRDGEIATVNVKENSIVLAGDILATLDRTDLDRQVRQGEINVEQAQINLGKVQNASAEVRDVDFAQLSYDNAVQSLNLSWMGIRNAEIDAEEMRVQAQRAREQAHLRMIKAQEAGTGVDRARDAYELALRQEAITALSADALLAQAHASYQSALYRREQAARTLERLDSGPNETQVKQLEIQLAMAQLSQEQNLNAIDDSTLYAPLSGKIVAVDVNVGDSYRTSQTAFAIVDDSVYFVDITIDEIDIGKVTEGQRVDVTLDAFSSTLLEGSVESIEPASINAGGIVAYPVRIRLIDLADVDIRSGMTASVLIYTATIENALMIPNWAIRIDQTTGQVYCFVIQAETPVRTNIELGVVGDIHSEVLSGVNVGDVIGLVPEERTLPMGP